ncbi:MAG: DHA2 family efflux MFS transporter permease subunit [Nitrospirae bacterium]|jgi:DHA2 family multidrug resistance protein|nr:DHA2 family efflux MFS transporter permease subunit [Nitrospirota bacterium]
MEMTVSHEEDSHPGYPMALRVPLTMTAIGATLIETIDSTVVNVGLPKMMGGLDASVDEIAWVITAYSIGNVLMIPMTRFVSDRIGRKKYFTGSILLFTLFSYLCAGSTSLFAVILFRLLQGVTGAAFFATSQTLLIEAFPREQIGLANALFAVGISIGPALGPVIGGYLVYHETWPWMFYINVPIGVILTLMSWKFVPDSPYAIEKEETDLWGIALLLTGIPALQTFLEDGQRFDWFSSPLIRTCFFIWIISLPLFIVRQFLARHPLIDLRVLKNRSLFAGSLGLFLLGTVYFGTLFTVPLMGQSLLGWNPLLTGIVLLPGILGFAVTSMVVGGSMGKIPLFPVLLLGVTMVEISLYQLAFISPGVGPEAFFWPLMFRGIGLACLFPPIMTLAMATLPRKMVASGAAIVSMMGQLGGAIGIAGLATLMQRYEQIHRNYLSSNLVPSGLTLNDQIDRLTALLSTRGLPWEQARKAAISMIDQRVEGQSLMLTYGNLYVFVGSVALVLVVLVFLFEKTALSHPASSVKKGLTPAPAPVEEPL